MLLIQKVKSTLL